MTPLLLVISVPRTGSNVVMEGLGRFAGLEVASELFNARGVYGLGRLGTVPGLASDDGPPAQWQLRARDAAPLPWLRRIAPRGAWAFKLMPDQLAEWDLATLLDTDVTAALFVTRGRLSRYASLLKAEARDVWTDRATTALRPQVNPLNFLADAHRVDRWYAQCAEMLEARGLPFQAIPYETDVEPGFDSLLGRLETALRALGLPVGAPRPGAPWFRKQDAGDVFDRVVNGAAL
ncbi:MAG: hypothetical protein ACU0CI_00850, partial [Shimia sp.]